jgi:hypothetical protein
MKKLEAFRDKMRELILYVSQQSQDDPAFGATKLNKILFFADFLAYRLHGKAITGQPYQKLDFGPAPKCLLPLRGKMVGAGDLALQHRDYYGEKQVRTIALRNPDLGGFNGREIAVVDFVIKQLQDKNATEVTELSHRFAGWELAELGEEIPYQVALLDAPGELSQTERQHGRRFCARARQLAEA